MLTLLTLITALHISSSLPFAQPSRPVWVPHVRTWIDANEQAVLRELLDLLAIPNVAADRANVRRNAEHLRRMLEKRGFSAELLETAGNPLVFGDLKVPGATRTLLLYCHYDGQPSTRRDGNRPTPSRR